MVYSLWSKGLIDQKVKTPISNGPFGQSGSKNIYSTDSLLDYPTVGSVPTLIIQASD